MCAGFGRCYGFAAIEELRQKFHVEPNRVLVDSGYLPKGDHGVYAACCKYGWTAVKGDKDYNFVHRLHRRGQTVSIRRCYSERTWGDPGSGTKREGAQYCNLIRFSKPQLNQKVQELIESGAWEEPLNGLDAEMEKEYNAQMAARIRKTSTSPKTGEISVYWYEAKNDHARDLANMNTLGAILAELLPDPVLERLTKSEKAETEQPV